MEYSQNATLVFISAYSIYVFCGKITIPLSTRLYQQRYLFWLRGWDLKGPPQSHSRLSSPRYTRLAILLALWGIPARKRYLIVFSCSPTTSSVGRGGNSKSCFVMQKNKAVRLDCLVLLVAEVGFEPHDLRVMSPTSYQAALLRDIELTPWCR